MSEEGRRRCTAAVYHRDTYRVHRMGGQRFKMHYNREQCKRLARPGGDRCSQHQPDYFLSYPYPAPETPDV